MSRRPAPPALLAATAGAAFALLLALVAARWSPLLELDRRALHPVLEHTRGHPTYRSVIETVTATLHSQWVMLYTGLGAAVLAARGRRGTALWLVLAVGTGSALNPLLKQLADRDRPAVGPPLREISGLSFPSGHASSAALACAAFLVVLWPMLRAPGRVVAVTAAVVVPAVSAWTRLALGGHYPSDLLAGFLLGVAWIAGWTPVLPALARVLDRGARPRTRGRTGS